MKKLDKQVLPRRRFLQQMVLLGGATSTGAMVFNNARAISESSPEGPVTGTKNTTTKGYRLTEHIRTYYEKAQI